MARNTYAFRHRLNHFATPGSVVQPRLKHLIALMSLDLLFILLHVARRVAIFLYNNGALADPGFLSNPAFALHRDRAYPELFQYMKEVGIMVLFVLLFLRKKQPVYLGWAATFLLLFADDAFLLHETFGVVLAAALDLPALFGLRSTDLGELIVYALLGLIPLLGIVVGYLASNREARRDSWLIVALFGLLVVFGVGVDLIHELFEENYRLSFTFGTIEDGGEMLIMSMLAVLVFGIWKESEESEEAHP